jgi:SAM-dependent methyltransferase
MNILQDWVINKYGIFEHNSGQEISYPEIGNDLCFAVEQNSPWFNQRNELILSYLKKYAKKGDFLDIGGGNGFQAKALINANYCGKVVLCEPGTKGCMNAKKRGVDLVYKGIFQDFPFENYNIANCGLFDVIEHIEDDTKFLNELYEKLNPGSKVFINVPAMKSLWSETDEVVGHYRRYNENDIERIKLSTPFKLLGYTYFFKHYIIPLFLARVIPYKLGVRIGAKKLLLKEQQNLKNKNGLLDKFFNKIHTQSLNKINHGIRINKGTSLFFVLEK